MKATRSYVMGLAVMCCWQRAAAQDMGSPPTAIAAPQAARQKDALRPRTKYDPFTKTTATVVDVVEHLYGSRVGCTATNSAVLSIALEKVDPPIDSVAVVLMLAYSANEWLFIDDSSPLDFLVRDSVISVRVLGVPTQEAGYGGSVTEALYAAPTIEQLRAIGVADSTTMRIVGRRGHCDVRLDAKAVHTILLFDERIVGDSTATPPHN